MIRANNSDALRRARRRQYRWSRAIHCVMSAALGAVLCFASRDAKAQDLPTGDVAVAAELFQQGRGLIEVGRWDEGCAKFEASFAVGPRASTLLNIGDCRAHEGKLALALATYEQALTLNRDTQGDARRKELEAAIQESLTALRPRVPKVTIVVHTHCDGLVIRRDGQTLPLGSLGVALPIDPGPHEIVVLAPGYGTERRAMMLAEGKTETVEVSLTPVVKATVSWWQQHRGSTITGSLAIALAGVGVGLGVSTVAEHSALNGICTTSPATACSDAAKGLGSRAVATNVVLGIAGAAAATSVVLFLTVERRSKAPDLAISLSARGAIVTVRY